MRAVNLVLICFLSFVQPLIVDKIVDKILDKVTDKVWNVLFEAPVVEDEDLGERLLEMDEKLQNIEMSVGSPYFVNYISETITIILNYVIIIRISFYNCRDMEKLQPNRGFDKWLCCGHRSYRLPD